MKGVICMKYDVLIAVGLLVVFLNIAYRRGKERKNNPQTSRDTYRM